VDKIELKQEYKKSW